MICPFRDFRPRWARFCAPVFGVYNIQILQGYSPAGLVYILHFLEVSGKELSNCWIAIYFPSTFLFNPKMRELF